MNEAVGEDAEGDVSYRAEERIFTQNRLVEGPVAIVSKFSGA